MSEQLEHRQIRHPNIALRVGAAFTILAGVSTAACMPQEGNLEGPYLTVTGDSNTVSTRGQIKIQLEPDYAVTVQAQNGQRIDQMTDELEKQVNHPKGTPEASIIYLGTNDVMQEYTDWRTGFDRMLEIVKDVPCVQLVTVNTDTDEHYGSTNVTAIAINQAIDQAVEAGDGRIHKIDWNVDWKEEFAAQDPNGPHLYSRWVINETFPDGVWIGDGIHHTEEGSIELVNKYAT